MAYIAEQDSLWFWSYRSSTPDPAVFHLLLYSALAMLAGMVASSFVGN
jgi:hypothetical protein